MVAYYRIGSPDSEFEYLIPPPSVVVSDVPGPAQSTEGLGPCDTIDRTRMRKWGGGNVAIFAEMNYNLI